jgi:hypothetical protein
MIKINFEKKNHLNKILNLNNGVKDITVIKTLILPKLVHLFTTLPNPGDAFLNNLMTCFFNLYGKAL